MKVLCIANSLSNVTKTQNNLSNAIRHNLTNTPQADVFVSKQTKAKMPNALKALLLASTMLAATSCATLRGGNFIYNENTNTIESFDDRFDIQKNNLKQQNNPIEVNPFEDTLGISPIKTNNDNLRNVFDKEFFRSIDIDKWVKENEDKLVGSCLFEQGETFVAKVTIACTKNKKCDHEFNPSHGTPIYKDENGCLKIMQIKPPRNYSENLVDYLKNSEKNFSIYLRDFNINTDEFSKNVSPLEGQKYGLLSAIQSVFSSFNVDGGLHCSECYMKEIQKFGYFENVDANKITPHTLLHLLVNMQSDSLNKTSKI